jgi:intracellular sulfur oxidation DsrE/DsrF family protein
MIRRQLLVAVLGGALAGLALVGGAPVMAQTAGPKVAIHVDEDDPATMNMALNNAVNIITHYQKLGQTATVEVVTYGPGLAMLRSDISPVASRISDLSMQHETMRFSACLNTVESIRQRTQKDVPLMDEAVTVPSGAVRLMELQYEGYAYLRP